MAAAGLAEVNVDVDRTRQEMSPAGVHGSLVSDRLQPRFDGGYRPVAYPHVANATVGQLRTRDEHAGWLRAGI